ncbi:hypothetical protein [Streptomyces sp.]|uniref:hypothetical protein n=1 Tax=Streptomyces sp. TaxID=1931 RepID=UPI002F938013
MRHLIAAAATQEHPFPWKFTLGLLAVLTIIKAAQWLWRPFAHCWCCKGSGRHSRKDGKVFRDCRWCRGSGRRLRVGRRVWNRFARVRKASA